MQTEIEAKFLDVDHDELRRKLASLGAELVLPERQMRRKNFDYPDGRLEKVGGWVRIRDEGDKVTMSYKQLNDRTLHGTKEVGIIVDDFDRSCQLVKAIGLEQNSYQETRRESWRLDGADIELDTWPWVKPYIEIEAPSEDRMKEVCGKLGLDLKDAVHGSVEVVYLAEYDVTEEEVDGWPEITFTKVPGWLETKRK
ncbi:MAG TPA: CYTH domain-containing protein [Candidatus Saccharimonadales bacterium]|nr:CYTH domain-containing protein [Candidatus Saccharimonadales bacterium]